MAGKAERPDLEVVPAGLVAERAGAYRNLTDDYLSLRASDPQFVPESNLRFAFTAALVASAYLGDAFSFALYAMASQPKLYAKIQAETDALFGNGESC